MTTFLLCLLLLLFDPPLLLPIPGAAAQTPLPPPSSSPSSPSSSSLSSSSFSPLPPPPTPPSPPPPTHHKRHERIKKEKVGDKEEEKERLKRKSKLAALRSLIKSRRQQQQQQQQEVEEEEEEEEDEEGREEEEEEEAETEARRMMEGVREEGSERVRVRRRLGSGKFSEVFLACLIPFSPPAAAAAAATAASASGDGGGDGGGEDEFPLYFSGERGGGGGGAGGAGAAEAAVGGGEEIVLKVLRPVPRWRVEREIRILQWLQGGPNVIALRGRTSTFRQALLLEYLGPESRPLDHGEEGLSLAEVRLFIYELLKALAWTHGRGVMHRDVKNKNVLINTKTKQLRLLDWGSADAYLEGKPHNVFVSTRYFKAPELLLHFPFYGPPIDLWGVGCILAGLLFKREPFFRGVNDRDQQRRVASVLGTEGLEEYTEKYGIEQQQEEEERPLPRKPWSSFINDKNRQLCSSEALDLLDGLLRYDHGERLSAADAMKHPFFAGMREGREGERERGREGG